MTVAMAGPSTDLASLLPNLQPVLHEGVYVYSMIQSDQSPKGVTVLGTFREAEGTTVICSEDDAHRTGLPILFRAAWITISLDSDLNSIGLTAAVSGALADAGISCNIVAAAHHDHLFVPIESAKAALQVLQSLQKQAAH